MSIETDIETQWEEAQDSLVLQSADFSLATLHQMVSSKQIDIAPEYQRRERWDKQKQAELIESFLLNMPVPPIYLAEESIGRYSVIDGKQRLTAISAFMDDQLRLDSLRTFSKLNGTTSEDLPDGVRTGLAVRPLRVVTVLRQSSEELKYEVFRRLNESAVPLNPQEIRNVLFRGPLNEKILKLSSNEFLKKQWKITLSSEKYKQMDDVELVLRFLTLRHVWKKFPGDYRYAMDTFMRDHRAAKKAEIREFGEAFETSIARCEQLWGEHAFHRPEGDGWRKQSLAGLYDAQMLGADALTKSEATVLAGRSNAVVKATRDLFKSSDFDKAVREATNTPARVRLRVQELTNMLRALAA
jgi:hypothetical protein